MIGSSITFSFFLIFSGAAIVATLALYTRQPLIIAYIALGACIGPYGLSLVTDLGLLTGIGHVGIIFLLFLLGLDMHPQALWSTLRKSTVVAVFSSAVFLGLGFAVAYLFGFAVTDALITGAAKRLGRAMALYLAGRGHDVAIHCNGSVEAAEATAAEARALGV